MWHTQRTVRAAHLHQARGHLPHALAPQRAAALLHHKDLPPLVQDHGAHAHLRVECARTRGRGAQGWERQEIVRVVAAG
jgi:hypothetical protein